MPNTNIKQLYGYILQQMAAESYFEGNELNSIEEIKKQLYLGANREGYKTNNTDLNEGYPGYTRMTKQQADEFLDKFKIVHQWSDNPTPTGKRPLPEGIDGKPKLNAGDLLANTGLSATLIQDKATGAFTLAIRSTEFRDWSKGGDGKPIRLAPGMNVTAEIKTGKRRVIEYLLSPIEKAGRESLRER